MSSDVVLTFDTDALLSNLENLHELDPSEASNALIKIIHVLKNTQLTVIQKEFNNKPQNLQAMVRKIKQIFAKQDPEYEKAIILAAELVQKLTASCTDTAKTLLETELLQGIILNTAHQKSSVRKCSRSCIANYVRYYKTLTPILKAFTMYGLQRNDNHYSKQCILLIIPNLINLDSSVISQDCPAFLELLDQVLSETATTSSAQETEFSKSTKKVLKELSMRFPNFQKIVPELNIKNKEKLLELIVLPTEQEKKDFRSSQQNEQKEDGEEEKGTFSLTQQTQQTDIMRIERFHFGFIRNDVFQKINNSQHPQEKIQAFEEVQRLLESESISIEVMDFFLFLADNLTHSTQITLTVLLLRLIKALLSRPGVFQLINQQKLSYSLITKVNETNKLVRQELTGIFSIIQKNVGYFSYINVLLSYLDCNQVDGFQISLAYKNRLLYLLSSSLISVKTEKDFDYKKLVTILSKLSNHDKTLHSKVVDCVVQISKHVIHQKLLDNLQQNSFNSNLMEMVKSKLKPIPEISPQREIDFSITQPQIETLYKSKSKQVLPPILSNGLLSPTKQASKDNTTPRSKESSRSKKPLEKMVNQFYETEIKDQNLSHLNLNKDFGSYEESKNGSDSGSNESLGPRISQKIKQQKKNDSMARNLQNIKKINPSSQSSFELPKLQNSQSHSSLGLKKQSLSGKKAPLTSKIDISQKYQDKPHDLQLIPEFEIKQEEEESNRYVMSPLKRQVFKNNKKGTSAEKYHEQNIFQQTMNSISGQSDVFSQKNVPGSRASNMGRINRTVNNMSSVDADSKYQTYEELEPLVNAELEWKICLADIRSDNWSRQFEACNILRRAVKYNLKDTILKNNKIDKQCSETFHEIMISIVKMVESLRSSVSKLSMITLNEMFETVPKSLIEYDFEQIFQVLMKKSVDTNIFIFEQADKTLINLCKTMTESKVFQMLNGQKGNKSNQIRAQVCRCLTAILLKKLGGQMKKKKSGNDIEKQIIAIIGQFMGDANQDVRYQAKLGIREIGIFKQKRSGIDINLVFK